jgi:hypothetical protein
VSASETDARRSEALGRISTGKDLLYIAKDGTTILMVQTFGDYKYKQPIYHMANGRRLKRILLVHLKVNREPSPDETEERIANAVENIIACAPDVVGLGGLGKTARRLETLLRQRHEFKSRIGHWGGDVGMDAGEFLARENVPEPW